MWEHARSLQMELIDLQANVALREHFGVTDHATFWLQTVPETVFPGLTKVALYTLTMFGSTYSCETAFSTMNIIKNKYRSRLTNEHLQMCMRMALTPFQPRFKLLAGQAKAHFSHKKYVRCRSWRECERWSLNLCYNIHICSKIKALCLKNRNF